MKVLRVAMIGFGGIGAVHKVAYDELERKGAPVKLVAVCDKNSDSVKGSIKTNLGTVDIGNFDDIDFYSDCDELIKNAEFDAADICLPTFLHKEYTLKLLRAGKHVLCEKPMALSFSDCKEMTECAKVMGRELAIGQCLRFDPAYLYLKKMINCGELGKPRRITMGALSYMPGWSGWFSDAKKSGGCIFDFHIHDVDILRFLLGEPQAVSSVSYREGDASKYVNTRFMYDGIIAEAEASFDESNTAPYARWYRVRFDKASVVYKGKEIMVYPDDGEPYEAETVECDRTVGEISYFANVILNRKENTVNSGEIASGSIRLCELIAKSAELQGDKIYL
jgi:predicted dehydrogenase